MANDLLNELNRNLKSAEEVGDKEWAKRLKSRIAKLEKAAEPKAPAPAKSELAKSSTNTVDGSAASKKLKES